MHIFLTLILGWVVTVQAEPCKVKNDPSAWVDALGTPFEAQRDYLVALKHCLDADPEMQAYTDEQWLMFYQGLEHDDSLTASQKEGMTRWLTLILMQNAAAGYASSQHNLAVTFNAPADSLLAKAMPQDMEKFIYWTRKAAAQKEPRALFNLSMRYLYGLPEAGVPQDTEMAYVLLKGALVEVDKLEGKDSRTDEMHAAYKPFADKMCKALNPAKCAELASLVSEFNFGVLDPELD